MVDPIWEILREEGRYNLIWLARKTGYSHSHVKAIACGVQPAGPRFRAACARVLGRDEAALFGPTRVGPPWRERRRRPIAAAS